MNDAITLTDRIRFHVFRHGPCTISQVVAAVGKYIPAVQAVRAAERLYQASYKGGKIKKPKIDVGKRYIVSSILSRLATTYGELDRLPDSTYQTASKNGKP